MQYTIEGLLQDPDNTFLNWNEPRRGLTSGGFETTAHLLLRASVADCIAMEREKQRWRRRTPDKDLLEDFITLNLAFPDPSNEGE